MAINVKHGLGIPGLVGDYESGRKKAMTEGARIADGQRRPELVAPAVLPRGQQGTGSPVIEETERTVLPPARPVPPTLVSPQRRTSPFGTNPLGNSSASDDEQSFLNDVANSVAQNNERWADYRRKMIEGGWGDPGPSAGAATGVYGDATGRSGGGARGGSGHVINNELSENQISDFNALSDAYEQAVKSGDFSEEELADARRQIQARQAGFTPMPRIKKAPQYYGGRNIGDMWEENGMYFTIDSMGIPKPLKENPREPTRQDVMDLYNQANNFYDEKTPERQKRIDEYIRRGIESMRSALSTQGDEGPYFHFKGESLVPINDDELLRDIETVQEQVVASKYPFAFSQLPTGAETQNQSTQAKEQAVRIETDEEYESLSPGTVFIGPDKIMRRKPSAEQVPAPSEADPVGTIKTQYLKDGTEIKVRKRSDGKWERVRRTNGQWELSDGTWE